MKQVIWSKGKSFTVDFWSNVFYKLRWWVPSRIILWLLRVPKHPAEGYNFFIEIFALANLLFSIGLLGIYSAFNIHWFDIHDIRYGWLVILWGGSRVYEIIVIKIYEVLFKPYIDEKLKRKEGKFKEEIVGVHGFTRFMILTIYNYIEIIFWFALFYHNLDWMFETGKTCLNSFLISLNFSFFTMTTFGYSAIYPKETLGIILTLIQSVIGLFMILLIFARFISLLPPIRDLGEFKK
ncbi:MAG: Uncharacterized protein FD151_1557 [bacterium]|nr:MAG: Uncharacterized protein FD151_1557 [bacterium]